MGVYVCRDVLRRGDNRESRSLVAEAHSKKGILIMFWCIAAVIAAFAVGLTAHKFIAACKAIADGVKHALKDIEDRGL